MLWPLQQVQILACQRCLNLLKALVACCAITNQFAVSTLEPVFLSDCPTLVNESKREFRQELARHLLSSIPGSCWKQLSG